MKKKRLRAAAKRILDDFRIFFYPKSFGPKVFCIGYNKTGTTSLGKSLGLLGFKNSSFNRKVWRKFYKQGKIEKVIQFTARFESFDDLPWLKEDMIPLLDQRFPGSKFIYLERDEASWKQSYQKWTHSVTGNTPDAEQGWAGYLKHREFVLDYFKDASSDSFLTLTIKDPQGLEKLGNFLGRKAPQAGFPHFNKTQK